MSYQTGNTVRLSVEFKDWDGANVDPESLKLIIYDYQYSKVSEQTVRDSNKTSKGNYYYDYVFEKDGGYIYEWKGMIQGLPSLIRKRINISQV